jgi:hypothetical protein
LFRIRLYGDGIFTPLLTHPETIDEHPNPVFRLGAALQPILNWCRRHELEGRYESQGGVAIPKAQIAAVRGGLPRDFGAGTEVCSVYLEVVLTPAHEAAPVLQSLERHLRGAGVGDFDVEPVVVRHGFEADAGKVAPLVAAVDAATRLVQGQPLKCAAPVFSSMWRDHNIFNMNRIPAVTTGMKRWRPTPQDLAQSALIYALTALAVCGKIEPQAGSPIGSLSAPVYGENPFD